MSAADAQDMGGGATDAPVDQEREQPNVVFVVVFAHGVADLGPQVVWHGVSVFPLPLQDAGLVGQEDC